MIETQSISTKPGRRAVRCSSIFIRRYVILFHRWTGIVFCLLFLMWFLSGIVLMYCDYPAVTEEVRLQHLPPLDGVKIWLSPESAAERVHLQPDSVVLSSLLSRPVYRLRSSKKTVEVYADSGAVFHGFTEPEARQVAAEWVHLPASQGHLEVRQITEDDQWTVQQKYQAYRPLWKFSWPDGQETYVSDVTGEVVQYTTRASRLGAYFGAIPHWIYITRLRRDAAAWRLVVIWLSGGGTIMTAFGLIAGLWMYSPFKRYRYRGSASSIPYSGQMRWHIVLGLIFGLVTFTWILSGLFSMTPIRWPENSIEAKVRQALVGAHWNGNDYTHLLPAAVLADLKGSLRPHELELTYISRKPVYFAVQSPAQTAIVSTEQDVQVVLNAEPIRDVVAKAAAPYSISESRLVTQYESYYVDREHRKRLPALYVRLNDPQQTIFYIDLHNGHIAQSYGRMARWGRWIYRGLHEFDLPWLYRNRPVWDVVMLFLLVGGTWLSITGVIVGWRRLIH